MINEEKEIKEKYKKRFFSIKLNYIFIDGEVGTSKYSLKDFV